jgi:uncharacterized membrane protein YbaN (DUF454 family)
MKTSPKKILLICAGTGALAIGGIGLFLPVLPTTPFVLCAAGCYSASSPKLYRKLSRTKYFGEYVRNYKEKTGISTKTRLTSIAFLWIMLLISMLIIGKFAMYIVLSVIGVAVTIHIATIRRKVHVQCGEAILTDTNSQRADNVQSEEIIRQDANS